MDVINDDEELVHELTDLFPKTSIGRFNVIVYHLLSYFDFAEASDSV